MEKLRKVLAGRQFTYYMTTSLMVVAVIGILVVLNILLQEKDYKFDFTSEKRYSITPETRDYLTTKLKKGVTIKVFKFSFGEFDDYFKNVINEYKNVSPMVKIEEFDPAKNPTMVSQYKLTSEEAAIIVESGAKYKKVSLSEVYNDYTSETASLESKLTGAINYVTDPREIKGYFLQGHSEIGLKEIPTIESKVKDSGMDLEEIELATKKEVPADASVLIIAGAKSDLSDDEKVKIENYLKANGKLMVLLGPVYDSKAASLKNLGSILKQYNMEIQDDVVIEKSESRSMIKYPTIFIPELQQDEITDAIMKSNNRVAFPDSRSVKILGDKVPGLTVTSIAKTTAKSWGETSEKIQESDLTAPDNKDFKGPLDVYVKAEKVDSTNPKNISRVIVCGSFANVIDGFFKQVGSMGNVELFATSTKWLTDYKETISIPVKSFKNENITLTSSQEKIIIVTVILLPLIFIGAGIYVWRVRKRL